MNNTIHNSPNKENKHLSANKNNFYDSYTKVKAFICNQSTTATNKCKSVFDSYSTEYGKVLSYGKPLISKESNCTKSNIESRQKINPLNNIAISKEEISHEKIPHMMRNNENFKTILCRKLLKHPRFKTNKTFTKQDFISLEEDEYLLKDLNSLNKRRKVSSVKVLYIGHFELETPQNKKAYFDFYRDDDIGIQEDWQEFIIESNIDEDVETDEEILEKLNQVVYDDLIQGINELKNSKNSPDELLHNYRGI